MRSRDRDRSFLLSIYSIVLLHSLALSASEYLISYRYTVKDAILYNETLSISHAMKKCDEKNTFTKEELVLENGGITNLQTIISKNTNEFIDYIHKLGMHIQHKDLTVNLQNASTTVLTLKTSCFKVDFNDTFVRIVPLK